MLVKRARDLRHIHAGQRRKRLAHDRVARHAQALPDIGKHRVDQPVAHLLPQETGRRGRAAAHEVHGVLEADHAHRIGHDRRGALRGVERDIGASACASGS